MSLFISVIFWNIMQVISSNDNGSVHLGGNNSSGQNLTSNGDSSDKWTFLVNV